MQQFFLTYLNYTNRHTAGPRSAFSPHFTLTLVSLLPSLYIGACVALTSRQTVIRDQMQYRAYDSVTTCNKRSDCDALIITKTLKPSERTKCTISLNSLVMSTCSDVRPLEGSRRQVRSIQARLQVYY